MVYYRGNISSSLIAFTSELLENGKEMFFVLIVEWWHTKSGESVNLILEDKFPHACNLEPVYGLLVQIVCLTINYDLINISSIGHI